jgi:hypothetical protein
MRSCRGEGGARSKNRENASINIAQAHPGGSDELERFEAIGMLALHGLKMLE